jgi:hypothetical protein
MTLSLMCLQAMQLITGTSLFFTIIMPRLLDALADPFLITDLSLDPNRTPRRSCYLKVKTQTANLMCLQLADLAVFLITSFQGWQILWGHRRLTFCLCLNYGIYRGKAHDFMILIVSLRYLSIVYAI